MSDPEVPVELSPEDSHPRAREALDPHGEHACSLFLARLSAAAGHPNAASVWAMIAAKAPRQQSRPG